MRKRYVFATAIVLSGLIIIPLNGFIFPPPVVALQQRINSYISSSLSTSSSNPLSLMPIFKHLEPVVQMTSTPSKPQSPNTSTSGSGIVFLKEVNDKGCYDGSVSGGERSTCRKQGDIKSVVSGHNYGIYATVVLGQKSASPKDSGTPNTEITSGGPGSREGNCCGITVGVHNDDGTPFIATEDWTRPSGKHTYLCDDSGKNGVKPCASPTGSGPIPGGKNGIYGQTVNLQWHVQRVGDHVTYKGVANGKQFSITNPKQFGTKGGSIIYPQQFIHVGKNGAAPDSSRLRVDGVRKNQVQTGIPQVLLE